MVKAERERERGKKKKKIRSIEAAIWMYREIHNTFVCLLNGNRMCSNGVRVLFSLFQFSPSLSRARCLFLRLRRSLHWPLFVDIILSSVYIHSSDVVVVRIIRQSNGTESLLFFHSILNGDDKSVYYFSSLLFSLFFFLRHLYVRIDCKLFAKRCV